MDGTISLEPDFSPFSLNKRSNKKMSLPDQISFAPDPPLLKASFQLAQTGHGGILRAQ